MSQITTVFYNRTSGTFRFTPPKRLTKNFARVEMDDATARQIRRDHRNARDRERYRRELAESGTVRWHWTPDPNAKDGAFEGPRFRFTEFLGADLLSEGPAALTTVDAKGRTRCASCGDELELGPGTYCLPCDRCAGELRIPGPGAKKPKHEPDPKLKGGKG